MIFPSSRRYLREKIEEIENNITAHQDTSRQHIRRIQESISSIKKDNEVHEKSIKSLQEQLTSYETEFRSNFPEPPKRKSGKIIETISAVSGIGGIVLGVGTLFYAILQVDFLNEQVDAMDQQNVANQRTIDWEIVGFTSVDVSDNTFSLENTSSSALMSTGTWLITESVEGRRFDALFFELEGIPPCSRIELPIDSIVQDVEPIEGLGFDEPSSSWSNFDAAYTYIVAPSGGLYSTSSLGGLVDHDVVDFMTQSSVNYDERFDEAPFDWTDPTRLVWVPDSYFEFRETNIGQAGRSFYAGDPILGREDGGSIQYIGCEH